MFTRRTRTMADPVLQARVQRDIGHSEPIRDAERQAYCHHGHRNGSDIGRVTIEEVDDRLVTQIKGVAAIAQARHDPAADAKMQDAGGLSRRDQRPDKADRAGGEDETQRIITPVHGRQREPGQRRQGEQPPRGNAQAQQPGNQQSRRHGQAGRQEQQPVDRLEKTVPRVGP